MTFKSSLMFAKRLISHTYITGINLGGYQCGPMNIVASINFFFEKIT